MWILLLSFVAWVMTILAPCVLPLLPIILWTGATSKYRSAIIIASFWMSVLVYSLTLQWAVQSLWIRPETITQLSAIILIIFWCTLLFPEIRQSISHRLWGDKLLNNQATQWWSVWWDILLGVVLWPIFNTCSPTYAVLIATILPASFLWWLTNIIMYILWLCLMLWLIAYAWRTVIKKVKRMANPNGIFKKILGIIVIFIGISILFKRDKTAETRLIENNLYFNTVNREYDRVKQFK